MKKLLKLLIISAAAFALISFSGCGLLPFNPTGRWVFTDDVLYANGKESDHAREEDMPFGDMSYVFDKNGTGRIEVNGTPTYYFYYTVNDKDVKMFLNKRVKDNSKSGNTVDMEPFEIDLTLVSDNDFVGAQMQNVVEDDSTDEDGNTTHFKEVLTYTKRW